MGGRRGRGPVGDTELHQDVRDVRARGLGGDEQLLGDLAVCPAFSQQGERLELAPGKS